MSKLGIIWAWATTTALATGSAATAAGPAILAAGALFLLTEGLALVFVEQTYARRRYPAYPWRHILFVPLAALSQICPHRNRSATGSLRTRRRMGMFVLPMTPAGSSSCQRTSVLLLRLFLRLLFLGRELGFVNREPRRIGTVPDLRE